jgi:hypothetical protein
MYIRMQTFGALWMDSVYGQTRSCRMEKIWCGGVCACAVDKVVHVAMAGRCGDLVYCRVCAGLVGCVGYIDT